jgi:hypothetical protein
LRSPVVDVLFILYTISVVRHPVVGRARAGIFVGVILVLLERLSETAVSSTESLEVALLDMAPEVVVANCAEYVVEVGALERVAFPAIESLLGVSAYYCQNLQEGERTLRMGLIAVKCD